MQKRFYFIFFISAIALFSCSSESEQTAVSTEESSLLSFSCKRSFEHFLDLDSILNTIPDTLGFEIPGEGGDSVDLRMNKAQGILWDEWEKYHENPIITGTQETDNSIQITAEFTGDGGYTFEGEIESTEDTLYLYYSEYNQDTNIQARDTRYILTYELKKEVVGDKTLTIAYRE
ncbi:MAG: hypothetical protein MI810_25420 [Flavobacteriales bacterium]|nr:hypothetical protein [Flavobacteriales bacterium]